MGHTEKEAMDAEYVRDIIIAELVASGWDVQNPREVTLSQADVWHLMEQPKFSGVLQDVGVDVVGLVDILDFLFSEAKTMTLPMFMEIMLQLRADNRATVKDIVIFRKYITYELKALKDQLRAFVFEARASFQC